jgi:DNA-binding response OmpR family regulator
MNDPYPVPAPKRVLVADDDENIADVVRLYLTKMNYEVDLAFDGLQAETLLKEREYDIAVLDIMMPGADGLQIVRHLRRFSDLPVILLTARTSDIDKVAGLQIGADDYMTKPFNPWELVARVEAVLRRARPSREDAPTLIRLGHLEIDPSDRSARIAGEPVSLTPTEFELLLTLVRFAGVAMDRRKLLEIVWGTAFFSARTVDVHIVKLRAKLPNAGLKIETVWGSGYRLVEVEHVEGPTTRRIG